MKKFFKFLVPLLLVAVFLSPTTAFASSQQSLQMSLAKPDGFDAAQTVEFEISTENSGTHVGTQSEYGITYDYIYLKNYNPDNSPAVNPHATVEFTVSEAGTYDFLIELMAFESTIPRTGLIQIDDGEKYYVSTTHGVRHLITEYYTGISAKLTVGVHTITVYLGNDFNDSTVKSVYFDRFSYVLVEEEQTPPPPPGDNNEDNGGGGDGSGELGECGNNGEQGSNGCSNLSSLTSGASPLLYAGGTLTLFGALWLIVKRR